MENWTKSEPVSGSITIVCVSGVKKPPVSITYRGVQSPVVKTKNGFAAYFPQDLEAAA